MVEPDNFLALSAAASVVIAGEEIDGPESRARASSLLTGSSVSSANKRTKSKVGSLIQLIWDEFYMGEPKSGMDGSQPENSHTRINSKAKCKAIPRHIIFFCQQLAT